jgi:hypothetical protein
MDHTLVPFDLTRMFLGDAPPLYFLEIIARILIVYVYTLLLLRWIGSRTIAQLSTVEFLLVIALGSAVGDSMFYPEVPLLHALLVITAVIFINKAVDMALYRSDAMKVAIDGRAVEVVRNGRMSKEALADRNMSVSELQEMLRVHGITNLGEIGTAYIEASGQMSVFILAEPRLGLPLIPIRDDPDDDAIRDAKELKRGTDYACTHCGLTGAPPPVSEAGCCIGPADFGLGPLRLARAGGGHTPRRHAPA